MKSSFKKKNRIFITAAFLGVVLTILGPFRSTWIMRRENQAIADNLNRSSEISDELVMLRQEMKRMSERTGDNGTRDIRRELLSAMGKMERRYEVTFRRLDDPQIYTESALTVETYRLVFEGHFKASMKTVKALEEDLTSARLSSVKLESHYDRQQKKTELLTEVYIQRIRSYED